MDEAPDRRVPDGEFLESHRKAEGQTSTTRFLERTPDIVETISPSRRTQRQNVSDIHHGEKGGEIRMERQQGREREQVGG